MKTKNAYNPYESFVITASAGSGKTHQLVRRYLHLAFALDDRRLSRILTVTFTRKAAAEMQQRIIEEAARLLSEESHLRYPFAWWNPWKLLANVGAIILIVGCVKAITDRKNNEEESGASSSFDWMFVWLLLAVGVTGLLTEVLRWIVAPDWPVVRFEGLKFPAWTIYFVHLVFVFQLLVYLPYSKLAHLLYRTTAMIMAERYGRTVGDPAD